MPDNKILFVLPRKKFCDEEYSKPREIFESSGFECAVVSSTFQQATSLDGLITLPDYRLAEVSPENFSAILLVGGVGCSEYWHDKTAHALVQDAHQNGKLVCAICLAPVTLANAGLLKGRRATAYPSAASYIQRKGAVYTAKTVEIDDNIITANGPEAALKFANSICEVLARKGIES